MRQATQKADVSVYECLISENCDENTTFREDSDELCDDSIGDKNFELVKKITT